MDQLRRYGGFSPHPDERIRRSGARGMEYVTKLLKDNHLDSVIETRANNALVPGVKIEAVNGDEDGAEFMRYCIRNMDKPFIDVLKSILMNTAAYGFELQQRVWKQIEYGPYAGMWTVGTMKPIPAELVKFDHDESGAVKPNGIVIHPSPFATGDDLRFHRNLFLHTIWGNTYNPYGKSLALACDFWVWAKELSSKFRLVYQERFGSPLTLAELNRQIKPRSPEWNDLVNLLSDLQNNSVAVVPQGIVIKLLEAVRSGDLDYDNLFDRGNKEISKKVLGSTGTTEGASRGQAGGYAQSRVMGGTTDNYAWIDALWIEDVAQRQIIDMIWYMNFDYDRPAPRLKVLDDDYARQVAMSNIFLQLAQSGAEIPMSHVLRELNIPQAQNGEPILRPQSIASPGGVDNQLFRARPLPSPIPAVVGLQTRNGHYAATLETERTQALDAIEADSFALIATDVKNLFEQAIQAAEALPEGQPVASVEGLWPSPDVENLRVTLSRGLWQHYLTGKWFATREIESNLPAEDTVPGADAAVPTLTEKFKALIRRAVRPAPPESAKLAQKFRARLASSPIPPPPSFAADPNLPLALLSAAESLKTLGQTIPVTESEVEAVANFYKELGQSVAGLIETDVRTIFEKLALGQKNGWSTREFVEAIRNEGLKYAGDLLAAAPAAGAPMAANHIETVYRNHMMRAFSDGKDSLAADPEVGDIIAGWTYVATDDDRTRLLHAALDGVSMPKDKWEGEFKYLRPPIFHNCRCDREVVTIFDVENGHQWTDESKLPAYDPKNFFCAH